MAVSLLLELELQHVPLQAMMSILKSHVPFVYLALTQNPAKYLIHCPIRSHRASEKQSFLLTLQVETLSMGGSRGEKGKMGM